MRISIIGVQLKDVLEIDLVRNLIKKNQLNEPFFISRDHGMKGRYKILCVNKDSTMSTI